MIAASTLKSVQLMEFGGVTDHVRLSKSHPAATIGFPARVAKLADALDLGSCTLIGVGVRLPPLALTDNVLLSCDNSPCLSGSCFFLAITFAPHEIGSGAD